MNPTSRSSADAALGYQQLTSLGTAAALTIPAGTCRIIFKVAGQPVRFRDDGTDPTTTVGYPLAVGAEFEYNSSSMSRLRFIETAASATLDVLYYG